MKYLKMYRSFISVSRFQYYTKEKGWAEVRNSKTIYLWPNIRYMWMGLRMVWGCPPLQLPPDRLWWLMSIPGWWELSVSLSLDSYNIQGHNNTSPKWVFSTVYGICHTQSSSYTHNNCFMYLNCFKLLGKCEQSLYCSQL